MNPFGTRGAADELARCLDGRTASAAAVLPGVALAGQLRSAGLALDSVVAPRPEFRDALRMRLMAVATVQAAQTAAQTTAEPAAPARALEAAVSWRRRGSAVAAGAMASVVAVSGVAVAGSQSLPGDPFYGVKRTAEGLQLRTADGDLEKGTRHLDFAATRLREVRGLTLGRDAVDAGPVLGPSAISSGIRLSSAEQPLAAGAALSPSVAARVQATLAEMDDQTREGSELLTDAYRSSRAPEPLRALSRFATRQTAGLQQLLPALPAATRSRAQISLALLTDVRSTSDELIGIGTCGAACDPTSTAPTLSGDPATGTAGTDEATDCQCPAPSPAPEPRSTQEPVPTPTPTTSGGTEEPQPAQSPSPQPSSPSPSSSPTPLVPLPVPVPTVPLPVPTITLPPAEPTVESTETLPGISTSSTSSGSEPVPAPAPTPLPQLAPLAPRP